MPWETATHKWFLIMCGDGTKPSLSLSHIHSRTNIHTDEEAVAISLPRHNMLQSEQIKSLACPGCSLGSLRMDWWGVGLCVWVCLIQIYCYLSGRQADFFAVSRGLNPSLKTVKDYILACFESILQQQTNTLDTRSACRIELMGIQSESAFFTAIGNTTKLSLPGTLPIATEL